MATGDQADFVSRIRRALPDGWFPAASGGVSQTPVLDSLMAGLASAWGSIYALFVYAAAQTRISTATDIFLDMAALDFLGSKFRRRPKETDAGFAIRVKNEIIRPRGTRAAVILAMQNLTGRTPTIFEPDNASDTGGYGAAGSRVWTGLAYGAAGAYGSMLLPFQAFVTAFRPIGQGIANLPGYNNPQGGYGIGSLSYASNALIGGQISDAEIYATVAATMPCATIAWTAIKS